MESENPYESPQSDTEPVAEREKQWGVLRIALYGAGGGLFLGATAGAVGLGVAALMMCVAGADPGGGIPTGDPLTQSVPFVTFSSVMGGFCGSLVGAALGYLTAVTVSLTPRRAVSLACLEAAIHWSLFGFAGGFWFGHAMVGGTAAHASVWKWLAALTSAATAAVAGWLLNRTIRRRVPSLLEKRHGGSSEPTDPADA